MMLIEPLISTCGVCCGSENTCQPVQTMLPAAGDHGRPSLVCPVVAVRPAPGGASALASFDLFSTQFEFPKELNSENNSGPCCCETFLRCYSTQRARSTRSSIAMDGGVTDGPRPAANGRVDNRSTHNRTEDRISRLSVLRRMKNDSKRELTT